MKKLDTDKFSSTQEIVEQLNYVIENLNALTQTITRITDQNEVIILKNELQKLNEKVIAQGDVISRIIAGDYCDHRINEE